jgi:hypothetical protein
MEHMPLKSFGKSNGRLTSRVTVYIAYHRTFPERGDIYSEILGCRSWKDQPLQSSSHLRIPFLCHLCNLRSYKLRLLYKLSSKNQERATFCSVSDPPTPRFDNAVTVPNYEDMNLGSSVGIATGYGVGWWRSRSSSPTTVKKCNFSVSSRPSVGSSQPSIEWVLIVKTPVRGYFSPTSVEVKKTRIFASTTLYAFIA